MEGFSLGNGGDTGISMLDSMTFGALIGTVQKRSHKRDLRASGSDRSLSSPECPAGLLCEEHPDEQSEASKVSVGE